jgi:translation initiation factor IF-3
MNNKKEKELYFRINNEIRNETIRLTGDNVEPNVYDIRTAIRMANDMGLDLIEINSKVNPPICKIDNYDKFLYNMKKKQKEIEKNNKSSKVEIKEIRFTPNIDQHDYNFKKNHIINFLKGGDKVKVFVFFKGREVKYSEKGQIILLKLADELSDIATIERMPTLDGYKMFIFLKPKKT